MRTRNFVVVVIGLLVALSLVCAGSVYAIDQWVAAPRDEKLCAVLSSQAAVVSALADDAQAAGQSIGPELDLALADLRAARDACR